MATEQYSILKARGYRHGVTIRPYNDPPSATYARELATYWPHTPGQEVPWVAARPIEACDDQRAALGWGLSGILGNIPHRKLHGDHTAWSVIGGVAKIRNIVYAIDIQDPAWVEEHLLALCRMADYDTSWIHFFNINGSQYDYGGNWISSSGDYHLHFSAKSGAWDTYHTLLYDVYRHYKGWPLLRGKQVTAAEALAGPSTTTPTVPQETDMEPNTNVPLTRASWMRTEPDFATRPTVQDGLLAGTCLTESWGYTERLSRRQVPEILAGQAAILAAVRGGSVEEIQAAMRAELDAAAVRERAERAAELTGLGERLAASVTERFGADVGQVVADEFLAAVHQGTAPEQSAGGG